MKEAAQFLCLMILFVFLLVVGLVLIIKGIGLATDNVPITVTVDGKKVYNGISGCVNVNSTGATTQVTVRGGFMCFFPKAYYVGKNIVVTGDER